MSKYAAFSHTPDGEITLICENEGANRFFVINGAWRFDFDKKAHTLFITDTKKTVPAFKRWEGSWPKSNSGKIYDYNEALEVIRKELKNGHTSTIPT